ncbi:hypothetical protein SAMN05428997_1072 [Bosea sp. CRIB-10]|nr:hypothetical protein SAMN05428997_1072 [Bosea sp. CRIB-10]
MKGLHGGVSHALLLRCPCVGRDFLLAFVVTDRLDLLVRATGFRQPSGGPLRRPCGEQSGGRPSQGSRIQLPEPLFVNGRPYSVTRRVMFSLSVWPSTDRNLRCRGMPGSAPVFCCRMCPPIGRVDQLKGAQIRCHAFRGRKAHLRLSSGASPQSLLVPYNGYSGADRRHAAWRREADRLGLADLLIISGSRHSARRRLQRPPQGAQSVPLPLPASSGRSTR